MLLTHEELKKGQSYDDSGHIPEYFLKMTVEELQSLKEKVIKEIEEEQERREKDFLKNPHKYVRLQETT